MTGFTPTNGTLQSLSSAWLFYNGSYSASDCANYCAHNCANDVRYAFSSYRVFRAALFGPVGASSPAACVANEITVTWDRANGQGSVTNTCTYDGDITLPTAPTKTGYTFSGWKLVTGSSN